MPQRITEISDQISSKLLEEFDEKDTFRKIDVEMIILGAVTLAYDQFLKDNPQIK